MLRVPGSFTSKHNNNSQVQIIREWNNQKFSIKPLLGDFLADEKNKKTHTSYDKYNKLLSRI
jgi:hypothetical protein